MKIRKLLKPTMLAVFASGSLLAISAMTPGQVGIPVDDTMASCIRGGCRTTTTPNCVNHSGTVMGRASQIDPDAVKEPDINSSKTCCDSTGYKTTIVCE